MLSLSMVDIFADTIGIIGGCIVLLAFYLLEAEKLHAKSKAYPLLNLVGAAFLLYSLYFNWNLPAVLVEVIWLLISIWGAGKAYQRNAPLL